EGWTLLIAAPGEGYHHTAVQTENEPSYRRDFTSVQRFAPSAAQLRDDPEAHPHYLARADGEQRRLAKALYGKRLRHEPLTVLGEIGYRAYFLWMAHEAWVQPHGFVWLLRAADWLMLLLAAIGAAPARAGAHARASARPAPGGARAAWKAASGSASRRARKAASRTIPSWSSTPMYEFSGTALSKP